jgi:hypothetical protein
MGGPPAKSSPEPRLRPAVEGSAGVAAGRVGRQWVMGLVFALCLLGLPLIGAIYDLATAGRA